jgi:lambda family phage tail tape measure protein
MSVIGQLLVELGVNTAAFKDGLDKATYTGQQFAKQVSSSFDALEESVKGISESFAQLDPAIGGAIDGIVGALGPLTGALTTVGGATAGFAAALVGAGVGAIGIAAHFSETAARLGELSQATGISVEQLSLLGNVAATKGIGVDQMAKALERMDKSALAAAQSGPKSANAFRDLGIAVTNADGSLRNAQDIFNDVSVKFAAMPDGPLKTAEAIKIFGRAGAEMIPLLNEGGAKLQELENHFTALNAVISGPTAASAEQFKENTTLLGAAFTGIENQITSDLLPALNEVAKEFISAFEGDQDNIKGFVDAIADVAKVVINLGQVVGLLAKLIVDAVGAGIEAFQQLGEVIKLVSGAIVNAAHGDFKGAWEGVQEAGVGTWNRIKDNALLAVHDIEESVKNMSNVWTAAAPAAKKPATGATPAPLAGADTSFVDKQVSAIERQAAKEQALAEAIGKATESQIDANAAAEAGAAIQKLMDDATDKGIQNTAKFKAALDAAIPRIQAAAEFEATFKAAIADQSAIDTFNKKIEEQSAMLRGDADAGTAVEKQQAKNNAALLPLIASLTQLGLKYEELRVQYGDADPRVKALAADFQRQSEEVKAATDATVKLNSQVAANAGKSEVAQQDAKVKALQDTVKALQDYGEANGKVAVAVEEFRQKTGAADAEVQKFKADLLAENVALQQQAAQKLATPGSSQQAQDLKIQIDYLTSLNGKWNEQTKSVNNYTQALNQVNAEYQDLLAKTGSFQQGATAAFADFSKSLQSTGQLMEKEITTALDGISSNFADMITSGKAKWQDLVNSMENALLKSSINNILNSLFKSLGGALSGSGNSFLSSLGGIFGGGHASGGDVTPGKMYLVGEQGPELLKVGAAGSSIIPNGQFGGGSGSGANVQVIQNITSPDVGGFKASQAQLHGQAMQAAQKSFSRFNQ